MLSIIIPTFNEKMNVVNVTNRIKTVIDSIYDYEIIFVDDSLDDTTKYLDELRKIHENVRYIHRTGERGLATAAALGIKMSKGSIIVVMDSDLQHPPELIPQMIKSIEEGYDIVIPSRRIDGGNEEGLNIFRKTISYTASFIGKVFLKEIRNISDPTGGFFAFKKKILNGVTLNPIGWKILIEVLVRGKYTSVKEIPYKFEKRNYGSSKMSFIEQINYLRHIFRLVSCSADDRRIFIFSFVGLLGVVINMIFYNIFVFSGFNVSISGTFSALIAMTQNFILNRNITWKDKKTKKHFSEALKFLTVSLCGIVINIAVLSFLNNKVKINYNVANLTGICAAVLWNYNLNRLWTWKAV